MATLRVEFKFADDTVPDTVDPMEAARHLIQQPMAVIWSRAAFIDMRKPVEPEEFRDVYTAEWVEP